MSLSKLPSGRWRAQVWDVNTHHNVAVSKVLDLPRGTSWKTKKEAKAAREQAREKLYGLRDTGPTVKEFWKTWTTDPLYARPKESTNIHNRERTQRFADAHKDIPIRDIGDEHVARWLAGVNNRSTVPCLRAMFSDAASVKAGRLIVRNPFAGLGLEKNYGRGRKQPPTVEQAQAMVDAAHQVSVPSFAGWLQCAQWTGMRPGELDALAWDDIDFDGGWITVRRQFNAKTRTFTTPKNGQTRPVPLNDTARAAILAQPRHREFVFVNLRDQHWTSVGRSYHWKAVRAAVGWRESLYLATRHFAGWYMYDVLLLDAEDVAFALGHTDGGLLVRQTYGHRSRDAGLDRVRRAFGEERKSA